MKVLIFSTIALPMDVVNAYRPAAFLEAFTKKGIYPILITNRWERDMSGSWVVHNPNDKVYVEKFDNYEIHRLPYMGLRKIHNPIVSKAITFLELLKGNLDPDQILNYRIYKSYIDRYLTLNQVDGIVSIFHPHYHHKLAYEVHKRYKIPYILDFQDLWENDIVTKSYNPSFKQKIYNTITAQYWKRWIKHSKRFTTTSAIWIDYLNKISDRQGFQVRNGHEIDFIPTKATATVFKVVYFGRLYPNMDYHPLINALNEFLSHEQEVPIQFEFIGIKNTINFNGTEYVKSNIDEKHLNFIEYLPKLELLRYVSEKASVFILPNFKEDNGQFMVKLYDYLALGKPVILAPKNGGDLEKVIEDVEGGISSSNPKEILNYLKQLYKEFCDNGKINYRPNIEKISRYHRDEQSAIMAEIVRKTFKND